jgi:hypothetical protein
MRFMNAHAFTSRRSQHLASAFDFEKRKAVVASDRGLAVVERRFTPDFAIGRDETKPEGGVASLCSESVGVCTDIAADHTATACDSV